MSDEKNIPSLEEFLARCRAEYPKRDYRAMYLKVNPGLAVYRDLAQWIMERYGDVRWQENGQYSFQHSLREEFLCRFLQECTHLNFGKYLRDMAYLIKENVINLWTDAELHNKLIALFRKHNLAISTH